MNKQTPAGTVCYSRSRVWAASEEEAWGLGVGTTTASEFLKPRESNFKAGRSSLVRAAESEIGYILVAKVVLNASARRMQVVPFRVTRLCKITNSVKTNAYTFVTAHVPGLWGNVRELVHFYVTIHSVS